ncbi:hypothetical protein LTR10_007501 [Elasticomyces elasticus]|nr:hypothetical protein LTR10_007501 [Elasticomyces elasticus]KAK4979308.1 hypothetical protein LTR42_001811 [Elasticomyces elasticus]
MSASHTVYMFQMLQHYFRVLQHPIEVKIFTASLQTAFSIGDDRRDRDEDYFGAPDPPLDTEEDDTAPIDYKYRHHPPLQRHFLPPSIISSDQYFVSSHIRYLHRHINSTPSRTLHTIFTMVGFFTLMAVPALFLGAIAAPVKAPAAALVEKRESSSTFDMINEAHQEVIPYCAAITEAAHDMTPYSTESENNTSITTINNNVQNITIIINNINNNVNNNGGDVNNDDLEDLLEELLDVITGALDQIDDTLDTVSDTLSKSFCFHDLYMRHPDRVVADLVQSLSDLLTALNVPDLIDALSGLLGSGSGSSGTGLLGGGLLGIL